MPSTRLKVLSLFFLPFIAALVWMNTLGHQFVGDDEIFIVGNESIRNLVPVAKFFSPESSSNNFVMNGDVWRPLTTFSYALTYAAAGLNPAAYHGINAALHLANGLLFFGVVLLILSGRSMAVDAESAWWTAWAAAAVFLTHPVQTESVAWVSQRSNLLFFFFYMLSLGLFVRAQRAGTPRGRIQSSVLSLACFALSLLSKEMAVSLPPVLFLLAWILEKEDPKECARATWAYFLMAGAFVAARSWALGHTAQTGYWAGGFVPQMLTMTKGFGIYVKLMLWPYPLSSEYNKYNVPIEHSVDVEVALAAAVILGLLVLAWKVRHTDPLVSFGVFLFFLSLGPVSNIVPIRAIINERFLYLGCAGFGMIAGRALNRLPQRGWFLAAALVLVGLYGAVSARRNLDWKDPQSMPAPTTKAKTVVELVSGYHVR
jgi:hypothetical protein